MMLRGLSVILSVGDEVIFVSGKRQLNHHLRKCCSRSGLVVRGVWRIVQEWEGGAHFLQREDFLSFRRSGQSKIHYGLEQGCFFVYFNYILARRLYDDRFHVFRETPQ